MKNKHIEVFLEYLRLLSILLEKVEKHFDGDESILHARLSPDMFPLCVQVEIVASFALRSCCPIAGVEVKSYSREVKSFANLKAQLDDTLSYVESLDEKENNLEVVIEDMAGPAPISMKAEDYLVRFAYPNFYFHFAIVYAISKSRGVPLTKGILMDFISILQVFHLRVVAPNKVLKPNLHLRSAGGFASLIISRHATLPVRPA